MEAFMTLWSYLQTRAAAVREEDGLVAIEYVVLGALAVTLIGAGFTLFAGELSAKFQAIF
jgi:Flp pilus assembly pilin Flp